MSEDSCLLGSLERTKDCQSPILGSKSAAASIRWKTDRKLTAMQVVSHVHNVIDDLADLLNWKLLEIPVGSGSSDRQLLS